MVENGLCSEKKTTKIDFFQAYGNDKIEFLIGSDQLKWRERENLKKKWNKISIKIITMYYKRLPIFLLFIKIEFICQQFFKFREILKMFGIIKFKINIIDINVYKTLSELKHY